MDNNTQSPFPPTLNQSNAIFEKLSNIKFNFDKYTIDYVEKLEDLIKKHEEKYPYSDELSSEELSEEEKFFAQIILKEKIFVSFVFYENDEIKIDLTKDRYQDFVAIIKNNKPLNKYPYQIKRLKRLFCLFKDNSKSLFNILDKITWDIYWLYKLKKDFFREKNKKIQEKNNIYDYLNSLKEYIVNIKFITLLVILNKIIISSFRIFIYSKEKELDLYSLSLFFKLFEVGFTLPSNIKDFNNLSEPKKNDFSEINDSSIKKYEAKRKVYSKYWDSNPDINTLPPKLQGKVIVLKEGWKNSGNQEEQNNKVFTSLEDDLKDEKNKKYKEIIFPSSLQEAYDKLTSFDQPILKKLFDILEPFQSEKKDNTAINDKIKKILDGFWIKNQIRLNIFVKSLTCLCLIRLLPTYAKDQILNPEIQNKFSDEFYKKIRDLRNAWAHDKFFIWNQRSIFIGANILSLQKFIKRDTFKIKDLINKKSEKINENDFQSKINFFIVNNIDVFFYHHTMFTNIDEFYEFEECRIFLDQISRNDDMKGMIWLLEKLNSTVLIDG